MTGIDSYSVTPATNATADGGALNYSEGQAPSTLNNSDRQQTADIRSAFNDLAWFQYSTGDQNVSTHLAVPAIYASGTSFTIAGADVTSVYHLGRRVRAVGVSTGTIFGRISVTSYAPTTTTVTVVWDSGSLSNETLVISLSQIPVTGNPVGSTITSWTPTLVGWTNVGSPNVNGSYSRIGRLVFVNLSVTPGTSISATSGSSTVTGLPFTVAVSSAAYSADGTTGAATAAGGLFNASGTTLFVGTTGVVTNQQIWSGVYLA